MTRRLTLVSLAASLAAVASAQTNSPDGDWIMNALQTSLQTKKGLTLHVKGQSIPMVVTQIGNHFVEGRSQQSSKIVVRLESIDAVSVA